MNGKYPKHPETSRKAITISIENFDLLNSLGGGGSRRFGTFPKFDRFCFFEGFPFCFFLAAIAAQETVVQVQRLIKVT